MGKGAFFWLMAWVGFWVWAGLLAFDRTTSPSIHQGHHVIANPVFSPGE
jgi:hypothetical protein